MKPAGTGIIAACGILTALFAQAAQACDSRQISLRQRTDAVIDVGTGNVLFAQNENTDFFPASMTKRMTLLLALRALRDGRLQEGQRIPLSDRPYDNGRDGVENGDAIPFMFREISVWDAVVAMNTASSNRAPQALARAIADGEDAFADMMNAEAERLGIAAHFENPAGYPTSARVENEHRITALGHAGIVRQLYVEFPEQMARLRLDRAALTGYTPSGRAVIFEIGTTNKFIRDGIYYQPEVVGGKTGTTCASGASMDAVWPVNGRLVIGVTSGHGISAGRYDALAPHIRRPDGVFLARLAQSAEDEMRQVMAQSFPSPTREYGYTAAARIEFSRSAQPVLSTLYPSPPDTPDEPEMPLLPPAIVTRFELAENPLRAMKF